MSYQSIPLREFLAHNVEDYLLGDLERMRGWNTRFETTEGGVSYPVLQTSFAGIELLGGLTSHEPFSSKPSAGRKYFRTFWTSYLYSEGQFGAGVANAVYTLFRNGIAHTFLPNGTVGVSRDYPSMHLRRDDAGRVYIDAHQIALDLKAAYLNHIRPATLDPSSTLAARMDQRLGEMAAHAAERSQKLDIEVNFPLL